MTLTQIKYFETVCETGSVTQAAKELFVSRPVVSRALRDLDNEFGIEAFARTPTGLELTDSGQILRNLFKEFDGAYTATQARIKMLQMARTRRLINVGITTTNGRRFFAKLYPDFKRACPDIALKVTEMSAFDSYERITDGTMDFFFTPIRSIPTSMVEGITLYGQEMVLCVAKDSPLAQKVAISAEDMLNIPLAHLTAPPPAMMKDMERNMRTLDGAPNIVMQTSQQDLMKEVIASGAVASILPDDMISDWPGVVGVPFNPPSRYTVRLIWNRGIPHSSAFYDTLEFIKGYDFSKL